MCKKAGSLQIGNQQKENLNRQREIVVEERRQDTLQQNQQEQMQEQMQENLQGQAAYENFIQGVTTLPQSRLLQPEYLQQPGAVGYKERKRRKAKYKKVKENLKKTSGKNLSREEWTRSKDTLALMLESKQGKADWLKEKVGKTSLSRDALLRKMLIQGDFSDFENLDEMTRLLVANQSVQAMMEKYNVNGSTDPNLLCRSIQSEGPGVSAILNPALRLGISMVCNSTDMAADEATKEKLRQLDEAMSTAVMESTLTHVADVNVLKEHYHKRGATKEVEHILAEAAIKKNKAEQIQIAKRLLLMQLSDFRIVHKGSTGKRWDRSMAVALSHCSRVTLTLPQVEKERSENLQAEHDRMWRSIFTTKGENAAGDNKRGSSTHSLERRTVRKRPGGFAETREKKVRFNFSGQRGMNCAIGGLGNAGVSGKMLSNDGSCGHFYSMYKQADEEHYGAMLMGMESDAYKTKNQLGHTHDIKATGEKASSFGAQRVDEIGNKYGGRQCDLTARTASEIADWMTLLENAMTKWQESASGMSDPEAIAVMQKLAGMKMTDTELDDIRSILERVGSSDIL